MTDPSTPDRLLPDWRAVPVEPTQEMLKAGPWGAGIAAEATSRALWDAMLAAAPKPPLPARAEDAGPAEVWRVGSNYRIHVYEGGPPGGRPVATFHRPGDAERAVAAVNASPPVARAAGVTEELRSLKPPSPDWLKEKIAADPDLETEVRSPANLPALPIAALRIAKQALEATIKALLTDDAITDTIWINPVTTLYDECFHAMETVCVTIGEPAPVNTLDGGEE